MSSVTEAATAPASARDRNCERIARKCARAETWQGRAAEPGVASESGLRRIRGADGRKGREKRDWERAKTVGERRRMHKKYY